jgi:dTDP-4-amino-4,6-dideoxygalactose transaminase
MVETVQEARPITIADFRFTVAEKTAVHSILDGNRISPDYHVKTFESRFASRHGCSDGLMTNSGTDALRIALAALKETCLWQEGDQVLVPALTFVATVNVVIQLNLEPVPVDVGMHDWNMNPDNLDWRLATMPDRSRIRGLIVAHLFGQPADMPRIMEVARKYKLKVLEDSCECMGVEVEGKSVGSYGEAACFSTYMAHLITTGVGGMITTNDPNLSIVMRSFLNHGRDSFYIPGYRQPALSLELLKARYRFTRIGYSSRPTEFEAAIGLCQLDDLAASIAKRQQNAAKLKAALKAFPQLVLPTAVREHAWMMFPLALKEGSKVDKFELCACLEKAGVETRELLPLLNQPCYSGMGWNLSDYSIARWLTEKGFYIPCHPYLTESDLARMISAFASFFERSY